MQIPAVWILATKLRNSDLNFPVDFGVDIFLLFFPRKKAQKTPPKQAPQSSPGTLSAKMPLGFLQKPFLTSGNGFAGRWLLQACAGGLGRCGGNHDPAAGSAPASACFRKNSKSGLAISLTIYRGQQDLNRRLNVGA